MIRSLKHDGVAVLLSSHLLERVQSVCDRVALFNAGQHRAARHRAGTGAPGARRRLSTSRSRPTARGSPTSSPTSRACKAVDQAGPSRYRLLADARRPRRRPPPPWSTPAARCGGCRSRSRASTPSTTAISRTSRCRERPMPTMRREGSPWRGLSVVFFRELFDHLTSARMLVLEFLVVLLGGAVVYFAAEQIRNTTAEDPFLFLRLFAPPGQSLLSFVLVLSHPGADHGDRARLRRRQRRIQPPHHVAHPGAADLSRRAAVREIPGRARDALDQPGHAVAAGDRLRPVAARRAAERRGDRRGCSCSCW